MARRFYSSTAARTTLASGVNDSTTTLSVVAVSGWPASTPYTLILDQDTVNEEIVEVTNRSGTTLTVIRGRDGTSGVAHSAGAAVNHGVSARDFDEPNAFINGTGVVTDTLLASSSVTNAKIANNAVTSNKIQDGTIVNADINNSAAIAQSKIANLTSDLASKLPYEFGDTEPTTTVEGFLWYDTNFDPPVGKVWDGTAFVNFSQGPADFSDAADGTYTDGGVDYKWKRYNASGTITITRAGFADVLVVGGGGGGGRLTGGGGGAGGHLFAEDVYLPAGELQVRVGAGGAGGDETALRRPSGLNGNASGIGDYIVAPGGGGGGGLGQPGSNGGSGGGGGGESTQTGGAGFAPQGNSGGTSRGGGAGLDRGGGGGGADAAGATGTASGNGGAGKANGITDPTSPITRAGGGGAGGDGRSSGTAGTGGAGGGGNGTNNNTTGGAGGTNLGGGGGGGGFIDGSIGGAGGAGGSGVIVVRVRT